MGAPIGREGPCGVWREGKYKWLGEGAAAVTLTTPWVRYVGSCGPLACLTWPVTTAKQMCHEVGPSSRGDESGSEGITASPRV